MTATGAASGRERRRFPRFPFPATVIVISAGDVETLPARDLGAGGIFVHARRPPQVGARVQVEFNLGHNRHFSVWGTVVRHETAPTPDEAHGFAVQFEAANQLREQLQRALLEL